MSTNIDSETIKRLARDIVEQARLRALSNEDLCREYLSLEDRGLDDELHVYEMMNRLWPEWAGKP